MVVVRLMPDGQRDRRATGTHTVRWGELKAPWGIGTEVIVGMGLCANGLAAFGILSIRNRVRQVAPCAISPRMVVGKTPAVKA